MVEIQWQFINMEPNTDFQKNHVINIKQKIHQEKIVLQFKIVLIVQDQLLKKEVMHQIVGQLLNSTNGKLDNMEEFQESTK